jgi:catechol 2,3-dioxygenase-like lactoylglutathione lyase family enzyme
VKLRMSHVGICVSDLERSLRFYCEGLGFEKTATHPVGKEFAPAVEVADPCLVAQFIERDGVSIELLCFSSPRPEGVPSTRRNRLGLTHVALRVDAVDDVLRHLERCGGTLLPETRMSIRRPDGRIDEFAIVADPDGTRVELMGTSALPQGPA